ncbi:pyridine nucleotide-disulfide oxidoreductase domain-containing protein [Cardiosporidium cionae]|uniref:NADPH:adrenodoxin oxidoreductase, mitochondrial n=1 Tax=Cardiosporidium cionae TaxID=476202 RepID=A0ABQ7J871_9APIC|nr:pyridine nucleotide-disulfide oxidoreductase domain-containing protein [Cardiosporidium cionae]|eukprot:KAF8820193.1 pyridine nucleotide-disulfide oxidoreductase domain-containing protein [Cardiosporidium cionae]
MQRIDMIERLPTPYGLVRFGVAPDHPEVKNVTNDFDKVASHPNFHFFGNLCLGKDVSILGLRRAYDATILSYGASGEKMLGIPGEDLKGVLSSNDFVLWYNGHPDKSNIAKDLNFEEKEPPVAAVIGNGNVALDIARILTKNPKSLAKTDIHEEALTFIKKRDIQAVHIIGRRGWVQAAFTNKELRELLHEDSLLPVMDPMEYASCMNTTSHIEMEESRALRRSHSLYQKMMENWPHRQWTTRKVLYFRFLKTPLAFLPHTNEPTLVGGVKLGRNSLAGDAHKQTVVMEDNKCVEVIPISLAIKSIGFKPVFLEGLPVQGNYIMHKYGCVFKPQWDSPPFLGGLYVSGWLKRGPTGIIATNIADAQETVQHVIQDLLTLPKGEMPYREYDSFLRFPTDCRASSIHVITYNDWLRIKQEELNQGYQKGKVANKFVSLDEILKFLRK